ncbi:hypothetical protein TREMEDRAFT_43795 [Tremella mesenterica DSM 1558]|uniref:uncharacterized protein n=1 Tax=Tremella mesenterica (strain ATCC 24925 / CBS 8224 / DSM 1558 / NBRC 9311 / NRRL Y-6157 / RJB 2259-6 / UBC 559-6) TaxID=578456 RepID=UPI0003F49FF1|nr:uncharacterized protein TREMEDRAFT_43795 [Tremella mesenterica DSM 1558]EIW70180.1 hypothetical protein TREMEDRAFT_43795 [Tremella mesenterica DSM 1558]
MLTPLLDRREMTGNYGPAAAAAAANAALSGNTTGRTVYVGSLPPEASVDELLNLVRFGPIERVHLVKDKSCVFISFLQGATAAAFHADAQVKKLALHGQALRIGWGQQSHLPPNIAAAVRDHQATRNVYIGRLSEKENEETLRDYFSKEFGPIDQVKVVRDKNCAFIHFLSIAIAIKVVNDLPKKPGWEGQSVNFGKDRCAYVPKAQQAAVHQAQQSAVQTLITHHLGGVPASPFMPFSPIQPISREFTPTIFNSPLFSDLASPGFMSQPRSYPNYPRDSFEGHGIRTVFLGRIDPETTYEDVCNNIRAGILQQIRFVREKNIAFVTFVEPEAAQMFYNYGRSNQLNIRGRLVTVGWAKMSDAMSDDVARGIEMGACRNVYIGKIPDMDIYHKEKLTADFEGFGDIEQINYLPEKHCAFVNFSSIAAAIKAVQGIKRHSDYTNLTISYGKDRCGNVRPPNDTNRGQRNPSGSHMTENSGGSTSPKSHLVSEVPHEQVKPIEDEIKHTTSESSSNSPTLDVRHSSVSGKRRDAEEEQNSVEESPISEPGEIMPDQ